MYSLTLKSSCVKHTTISDCTAAQRLNCLNCFVVEKVLLKSTIKNIYISRKNIDNVIKEQIK